MKIYPHEDGLPFMVLEGETQADTLILEGIMNVLNYSGYRTRISGADVLAILLPADLKGLQPQSTIQRNQYDRHQGL